MFQQDNARPHTAIVAQDFLRLFQTLPWLARSPDLSPVEHVWDQLKRQMSSCYSVHDLELALEVSEELGIAQSVISRLWQRFQDDGIESRCYSTGRLQVTTPNEDRHLAVTDIRNRRSTSSDLFRQPSSATCTTVSRQTVYRCLGHIGLYVRSLSDVFHLPQLTVACD
ncbi:HTH_Tnp_Tc3_2 domain-containing protein [Trichonephila clavipes]|nr:HTH_Tnp_Tc3_2 domain-containing protein [Trichonephila clavipes]